MKIIVITDQNSSKQAAGLANLIYNQLKEQAEESRRRYEERDSDDNRETEDSVYLAAFTGQETFEESFGLLSGIEPELVITIDMAGMWMESEYETAIFQYLYCKCIHILTKEPWFFPDEFTKKMHILTAIVVFSPDGMLYIRRFCQNVPAVVCWPFDDVQREALNFYFLQEVRERAGERRLQIPEAFQVLADAVEKRRAREKREPLFEIIEGILTEMDCPCSEEELTELTVLLKDIEFQGNAGQTAVGGDYEDLLEASWFKTAIIELIRWSKECDIFTL